jgi:hypothetical protein
MLMSSFDMNSKEKFIKRCHAKTRLLAGWRIQFLTEVLRLLYSPMHVVL